MDIKHTQSYDINMQSPEQQRIQEAPTKIKKNKQTRYSLNVFCKFSSHAGSAGRCPSPCSRQQTLSYTVLPTPYNANYFKLS